MMTNQELLTLAAKAAGYEVSTNGTDFWLMKDGVEIQHWNPLQQDDHALRLAVKLRLDIIANSLPKYAYIASDAYPVLEEENGCCTLVADCNDDELAAIRFCIVKAAALIGSNLAKNVKPQAAKSTTVKIYDQLLGLTFLSVEKESCEELVFKSNDGREFTFTHVQDCCEDVRIEDICGDLQDLVGSPLLEAEEVTYSDVNPAGVPSKDYQDSFTWTFYKFATIKGSVTVRWYGASNGYYSESVDLHESEVAK